MEENKMLEGLNEETVMSVYEEAGNSNGIGITNLVIGGVVVGATVFAGVKLVKYFKKKKAKSELADEGENINPEYVKKDKNSNE